MTLIGLQVLMDMFYQDEVMVYNEEERYAYNFTAQKCDFKPNHVSL